MVEFFIKISDYIKFKDGNTVAASTVINGSYILKVKAPIANVNVTPGTVTMMNVAFKA